MLRICSTTLNVGVASESALVGPPAPSAQLHFPTDAWSMQISSALHAGSLYHPLGWKFACYTILLYRPLLHSSGPLYGRACCRCSRKHLYFLASLDWLQTFRLLAFAKAFPRHCCRITPQLKQFQLILSCRRHFLKNTCRDGP